MKNMKVKALADGAVCTALTVLLMIIAMYVPFFAVLSILFVGTPLVYLGVRHGTRVSVIAAVAAILVLFILTGDPLSALLLGIINLLPGIAIGYSIGHRALFRRTLVAASASVLFGLLLELILLNASGGGNGIENLINGAMDNAKKMAEPVINQIAEKNPDYSEFFISALSETINHVKETIFLYLPSFVIGMSVITGYGAVAAGIYILHRLRVRRVSYIPFSRLHASKGVCYFAVICFLVVTFSTDSTVYTAALRNMVALLYGYIAVCGLSLIDYKFSKKILSGYMRAGIYALVFLVAYVLAGFIIQGLIILGLIDGIFNFRRLYKAGEQNVGHQ